MKAIYNILLAGCMAFSTFPAHSKEVQFKKTIQSGAYDYLVMLPDNYDTTEKFPIILFLHGSGERSDDLSQVKKHGPFNMIKQQKMRVILVAPQCPKDDVWIPEKLSLLLDQVESTYPVDKSRLYLTGLSMGGDGTWSLAARSPNRFAAIAPICGEGKAEYAKKLAKMPIWAFHGDNDRVVPLEKAQVLIDSVKQVGGNPKLTIYKGVGHDSWTTTYNDPELYKWLFAQVNRRKKH